MKPPSPRSASFLAAYALASAGGVLSYAPLLGFLLPARIEQMTQGSRMGALSGVLVAGAVVASLSNILAGILSDGSVGRGRSRRGWISVGLAATVAAYAAVWLAETPLQLLVAICTVQAAINFLLSPLLAMLADEVPDSQKGLASGLGTIAQPVTMGLTVLLVALSRRSEGLTYLAVSGLVAVLVAPLLATRAQMLPEAPPRVSAPHAPQPRTGRQLWLAAARLLPQTAMNVLSYYLIYYFEDVTHGLPASELIQQVSVLSAVAGAAAVPLAVAAGRWAAGQHRRRLLAQGAVLAAAFGLLAMRLAHGWWSAAVGYVLFAVATYVFLALHSALLVQALPSARHRGRDLGLQNLANTVPSLLGPALAVGLAGGGQFALLLTVLIPMVLASAVALGLAGSG